MNTLSLHAAMSALGSPEDYAGITGSFRRRAVRALLGCWRSSLVVGRSRNNAERALRVAVKQQIKDDAADEGYGCVIMITVATIAISAAMSWAIQRALNHFWPPKSARSSGAAGIDLLAVDRFTDWSRAL